MANRNTLDFPTMRVKSKIIHPGVGMRIEKALPFSAKIETTC